MKIHIGTSGFYYDHWIGKCYPSTISKRDLLIYFSQKFQTVEINSTFYHLPRQSTLAHWLEVTPDDFIFTLKAHRSITHMKRPDRAGKEIRTFIHLIKPIREKLGAILFQFPPRLRLDMELLDTFLSELPVGHRYAVEFRHYSWMDPLVFDLMAIHGVALCINDFGRKQTPRVATAHFVYIRMHGPLGRYNGRYDTGQITELCKEIGNFSTEEKEVFCYFNNDMEGYAWENAQELIAQCGQL